MDNKALIIKVNGEYEYRSPLDNQYFTIDELQEMIGGGYVEVLPSMEESVMAIGDEEGKLKGLSINFLASSLLGYEVVGDIAFVPVSLLEQE